MKKLYHLISTFFFDPLHVFANWRAIPDFWRNFFRYKNISKQYPGVFPAVLSDFYFTTADKYLPAGSTNNHYFHQDLWAARCVFKSGIQKHTDIGSRLDGFVAHILPFCEVDYVDLRKLDDVTENLHFIQGSILELPFQDQSLHSLSCLHVIEHIGLGRYGDPVDPEGHIKAARELVRVLTPGGSLYFATPTGKEKLYFDAHRVFSPHTIKHLFGELELSAFHLIDDKATGIHYNASFEEALKCNYGCGLYLFKKP